MPASRVAIPALERDTELARMIRDHDWAATSLGPIHTWPASLRTVVDLMLGARTPQFIAWGAELRMLYNDAYLDVLGHKHPALGEPLRDTWPEVWDDIGPLIDDTLAGQAQYFEDREFIIRRHGHEERTWFSFSYLPLHDDTGRITGVYCPLTETTGKVLAERERRASAERLQRLFEQAPGFMVVMRGPQHVLELMNHAYAQLAGHRELLGRPVRDAFPEVEGQGYFELLDHVYATGEPFVGRRMPVSLQPTPGAALQARFLDFVFQPIVEHDGRVGGIFIEGTDVTEQVRTEEALRTERDRSQSVFEGMAEGFALMDADWTLRFMNPEGQRLARRNESELLGRNYWEVFPELLGTDIHVLYERVRATGTPDSTVERYTYPDGSAVWLEIRAQPALDGGLAVFFRDVSARVEAEHRLQEADRRKDEFLAMLAHELRNPLAPIGAAAAILERIACDDERLRDTSRIIARQVRHMTGLVDDLLDVSRVTRGLIALTREPLDLRDVAHEAVEQVRPLIEARGHAFVLHLPSEPASVDGDRKRLVQVFANLLNNAAKYTPDGGRIELAMTVHDTHVRTEVIDNGIGMAPELERRVFDLFTQAERPVDRSLGGLGIGLALVRQLAELHGGGVACSSEGPGLGSRFELRLPRRLHAPDLPVPARPDETATHGSRSILIVDDNVDAATMLALLLESQGHRVGVEHDPLQALERAFAEVPEVCLLDIGLPGIDGNELARRLRADARTRHARLVAISGYGQPHDRDAALAAGFDDYLVKPVDHGELLRLLEAGRGAPPQTMGAPVAP